MFDRKCNIIGIFYVNKQKGFKKFNEVISKIPKDFIRYESEGRIVLNNNVRIYCLNLNEMINTKGQRFDYMYIDKHISEECLIAITPFTMRNNAFKLGVTDEESTWLSIQDKLFPSSFEDYMEYY